MHKIRSWPPLHSTISDFGEGTKEQCPKPLDMKPSTEITQNPQLEVSNFGPILDAKLDLNPLTVFVGPSNTGKSYLAVLTYAMHNFFAAATELRDNQLDFIENDDRLGSMKVTELLRAISKSVEQSEPIETTNKSESRRIILSGEVIRSFVEYLNSRGPQLTSSIETSFSRDRNALKNILRKENSTIKFRHQLDATEQHNEFMNYQIGSPSLGLRIPEEIDLIVNTRSPLIRFARRIKLETSRVNEFGLTYPSLTVLQAANYEITKRMMGSLATRSHYLPADRTAVVHAHQVVVSSVIQTAAEFGLHNRSRPGLLTGVQADYLKALIFNANAWSRPSSSRSPYTNGRSRSAEKYAKLIEDRILHGTIIVEVDDLINYPSFFYQPHGIKTKIPLVNASSMVAELAPIVLYLRHVVRPRELIIVEEPESHLHPAIQTKLVRILVGMVNDGFKIIITTHSEWIIEQLTNIVNKFFVAPTPSMRDDGDFLSLDPKKIGLWLFKNAVPDFPQLGSSIERVKMEEDGSFTTGYEVVAHELYNDWITISSRSKRET